MYVYIHTRTLATTSTHNKAIPMSNSNKLAYLEIDKATTCTLLSALHVTLNLDSDYVRLVNYVPQNEEERVKSWWKCVIHPSASGSELFGWILGLMFFLRL
jgi:hypothetical protein